MGTMEKISRKKLIQRRKAQKRKEAILTVIGLVIITIFAYIMFEAIFIYPEEHQPTARYQLKIQLDKGNERAIAYYKENCTDRGVYLYGEEH